MRKLGLTFALLMALVAVAGAFAATPSKGAWAGYTSSKPLNGFKALVSFSAASGGTKLTKFTFQTLGCFGYGQYPTGVDPYSAPDANAAVGTVPLKAGKFTLTATNLAFSKTDGIKTNATITGTVTNAQAITGTIAVSQSENGSTCGPTKVKFSVQPGTQDSLGLNGA